MKTIGPLILYGIVIFGILGIFIPTATMIVIGLLGAALVYNIYTFFNLN